MRLSWEDIARSISGLGNQDAPVKVATLGALLNEDALANGQDDPVVGVIGEAHLSRHDQDAHAGRRGVAADLQVPLTTTMRGLESEPRFTLEQSVATWSAIEVRKATRE